MRIPFVTRLLSKFQTTAQLAHKSAKDVHEIQERVKEQYEVWHEIKHILRRISDLERDLPKGERHKVMQKVFDHVDRLNESAKILDRGMESLREHVEKIHHQVEGERRAHGQIRQAETAQKIEEREARKIAKIERRRKKFERKKERHAEKAEKERAA